MVRTPMISSVRLILLVGRKGIPSLLRKLAYLPRNAHTVRGVQYTTERRWRKGYPFVLSFAFAVCLLEWTSSWLEPVTKRRKGIIQSH